MGRRDSLTASITAANNNIPGPNSSVATLVTKFQNVGLTLNDMVTLSGNIIFTVSKCLVSKRTTLSLHLGRGTHDGKSSLLNIQL